MAYYLPPWQRQPAKPDRGPAPPTLSQLALAEMKQAETEEAPFGGWAGELTVQQPQPTVTLPARPPIPAPDWEEERLEREQQDRERQERERERIVDDELARIADDAEPPETLPAKKRRWRT